ncbi:MAG: hypothetical protein M1818_006821 [Claussenomyces sp. TS43310]|nr:MAG: hypothetical protein M1818_006821 [Claussenomyces sp. TS43310]
MSKRIEPGLPASSIPPSVAFNLIADPLSSATRKRRPTSSPTMFTGHAPEMRQDMASSSTQSPAAKKSRTNTPWTAAEEQRLRQMRDAGSSWADIAKSVALLNAIKEYEANKWKAIGAKVGKPAKACEQYAKEHFSKSI